MADEFVARTLELRVNADKLRTALLGQESDQAQERSLSDEHSLSDLVALCSAAYSHRRALSALRPSLPRLAPVFARDLLDFAVHECGVWAVFETCRIRLDTDPNPRLHGYAWCSKILRTKDWLVFLRPQPRCESSFHVELLDLRTGRWVESRFAVSDAACLPDTNHIGVIWHQQNTLLFQSFDLDEHVLLAAGLDHRSWFSIEPPCPVSHAGILATQAGFQVLCSRDCGRAHDLVRVDSDRVVSREAVADCATLGFRDVRLLGERLCGISVEVNWHSCIDLRTSEILVRQRYLKFGHSGLLKLSGQCELAVFDLATGKFRRPNSLIDIEPSH